MLASSLTENCLTMSFRSTFAEIRSVLSLVLADKTIQRLGSDLSHDLELVLAEALNNVAEHAYGEGIPGQVSLSVMIENGLVRTEIRDYGRPFLGFSARRDVASPEEEGGRGILLMRSICRSVDHRRQGDENILTLELVSSS